MSESNKAASTAAVAQLNEGATVHETLVLILREVRHLASDLKARDSRRELYWSALKASSDEICFNFGKE